MKPLRVLSIATVVSAFVLVALSPIVRITGSGLGCGDHWPLCNGRLIPPLDNPEVLIEWGHRLAAATVSILVILQATMAWVKRREPGIGGAGGITGPAYLAVLLLVTQVMLGAVTVWFELPPWVVVLHMSNALALLAVVLVVALRCSYGPARRGGTPARAFRGVVVALAMSGVALLLGALTANLGAGLACLGFPLCSGSIWPASGQGYAHLHWMHRLVAYGLVVHMIGIVAATTKRGDPAPIRRAAWGTTALLAFHVAVAALMIVHLLPMPLRTVHAALGTGVWTVLVYFSWLTASGPAAGAAGAAGDESP
ncbi:MAG TPA: COX15/CtaA family protein [Gemmatimonadales bacterium]